MAVYRKGVKYVRDELSSKFGDMPPDEFDELVADIKKNGQRDSIIVRGKNIIDGWHRYQACMEAGIEPFMEVYDEGMDGEINAFVMSKNLFRRQMTGEQRARMAADLLGYKPGKGRRGVGTVSQEQVAAAAGVSARTARRALSGAGGKEKPAPTLDGLLKRKKMLEGQLASLNDQIAALQSISKPVKRVKRSV